MSNSSNSFNEYIKRHHISKGQDHTHTRIGDKTTNITGGCYEILNEKVKNTKTSNFMNLT